MGEFGVVVEKTTPLRCGSGVIRRAAAYFFPRAFAGDFSSVFAFAAVFSTVSVYLHRLWGGLGFFHLSAF
jgi:hypothetical protein